MAYQDVNRPCDDGLDSTSVEAGEDYGCHPGFPTVPQKVKTLVGLFGNSFCMFCPLAVIAEGHLQETSHG